MRLLFQPVLWIRIQMRLDPEHFPGSGWTFVKFSWIWKGFKFYQCEGCYQKWSAIHFSLVGSGGCGLWFDPQLGRSWRLKISVYQRVTSIFLSFSSEAAFNIYCPSFVPGETTFTIQFIPGKISKFHSVRARAAHISHWHFLCLLEQYPTGTHQLYVMQCYLKLRMWCNISWRTTGKDVETGRLPVMNFLRLRKLIFFK